MLHMAIHHARYAHGAMHQTRKYTGDPYIVHPLEVMGLVVAHAAPQFQRAVVLAAAVLHDVVEDTNVTLEDIMELFGSEVADYVDGLTDVFVTGYVENGVKLNRRQRKEAEAKRLAQTCAEVQTIKCADLISNSRTIVHYDPDFAAIYIPEKRAILSGLTKADINLWTLAMVTLEQAEAKLVA